MLDSCLVTRPVLFGPAEPAMGQLKSNWVFLAGVLVNELVEGPLALRNPDPADHVIQVLLVEVPPKACLADHLLSLDLDC